jgi:hypothetical protein
MTGHGSTFYGGSGLLSNDPCLDGESNGLVHVHDERASQDQNKEAIIFNEGVTDE